MSNANDCAARLAELLRREHAALADFLLALAAFDRERGWLELGHPSLFSFLHRELGLSKGAAYYRKVAADLVQNFPEVVAPLRDGRLCITSVVELAKVLTPENCSEVLPRFFHRSKQEAKAVSAELRPAEAAPHRDVVTALSRPHTARLPGASPEKSLVHSDHPVLDLTPAVHPDEPPIDGAQVTVHPDEPVHASAPDPSWAVPAPPPPFARVPPRDVAEPLTADLRRLHVTVSRRFLSKLDAARDALSHARPGASTEDVLEAALDLLLETHAKRKAALVKKPRSARLPAAASKAEQPPTTTADSPLPSAANEPASPPDTRYIPAAVRREVWTRDQGRCRWPLAFGGVCGSTCRVEFDHVVPLARGGTSTIGNVRILCRPHNDLSARRQLGDSLMDPYTGRRSTSHGACD
jgi:hypothetical protein